MSFEIEQIAELARLSLKPDEKIKLKKDLESILAYVDELKKVNTEKATSSTSKMFSVKTKPAPPVSGMKP